uniref:Uncharacterized protein n=1 Tax=Arundo donax TaxID=35708 RepID=A0A0A9CPI0_ARUDO
MHAHGEMDTDVPLFPQCQLAFAQVNPAHCILCSQNPVLHTTVLTVNLTQKAMLHAVSTSQ